MTFAAILFLLMPVQLDDPIEIGDIVHLRSSPTVPLTVVAVVDRSQQLPKSLWRVRVLWLDTTNRPQMAELPDVALIRRKDSP